MPSPATRRVLVAIAAASSGGGAGLGYAAGHDSSVLLTVPLGIVLVGTAVGLAVGAGTGLALGLSEYIRYHFRKRVGLPDTVGDLDDLLEAQAMGSPDREKEGGEVQPPKALDAAVAGDR